MVITEKTLECCLAALNTVSMDGLYTFEKFPNKKLTLRRIGPNGVMLLGTFGRAEAMSYREMYYYIQGIFMGVKAHKQARII